MNIHSLAHSFRLGIFLVFFLNLLYLNILVLKSNHNNSFSAYNSSSTEEKSITADDSCGEDCVANIYNAIYEATASATQNQSTPVVVANSETKEHYIPFGSGTSMAEEWTDVTGLQTYIDTSKYPNIKTVTFEASLYIPTGNQKAYVRLYNVTDKHPVWFSEMFLEGGQAKLLISDSITLDSGNKLYGVQMKTSLKYRTDLTQSRVRIVLQ